MRWGGKKTRLTDKQQFATDIDGSIARDYMGLHGFQPREWNDY